MLERIAKGAEKLIYLYCNIFCSVLLKFIEEKDLCLKKYKKVTHIGNVLKF